MDAKETRRGGGLTGDEALAAVQSRRVARKIEETKM